MPNDAKLGLVVGVGLVIAVAVLFARKDAGVVLQREPGSTAAVQAGASAAAPRAVSRPARGRTTARTNSAEAPEVDGSRTPEPPPFMP